MKTLLAPLALVALLGLAPVAAADCLDYFVPSHVEEDYHCDPDGWCYRSFCPVMTYHQDCDTYRQRAFCT